MSQILHAMTAMIEGQRLACWPTDKPSLINMLSRAGFRAAEIIEHVDDAAAAAGVGAGDPLYDPMVDAVAAVRDSAHRYGERSAVGLDESCALNASHRAPLAVIESGAIVPTTFAGAGAAVQLAIELAYEPATDGILKSLASFFRPIVAAAEGPR